MTQLVMSVSLLEENVDKLMSQVEHHKQVNVNMITLRNGTAAPFTLVEPEINLVITKNKVEEEALEEGKPEKPKTKIIPRFPREQEG